MVAVSGWLSEVGTGVYQASADRQALLQAVYQEGDEA